MPAVNEVKAAVRAPDGTVSGYLRIALLPRAADSIPAPLLFLEEAQERETLTPPIQLLEGYEYRYEWEQLPASIQAVVTDPEEIFQPDASDGLKGRLRPGLSTGTLEVAVRYGEVTLGKLDLEVRSRKLNYLSEYQWMLRDIADQVTELVMDRFAPSAMTFTQEGTRDAVTLYQRFAFLRALLTSEVFQLALGEITRRPHVTWIAQRETIAPTQPIKATSDTVRQLSRPGVRVPWPGGPVQSIPLRLERRRTEATHDTTPNRFVRFALERWRQVVADIERGLATQAQNAAVARGRREVASTLEYLDAVLSHDLFKDLSSLTRFPADDQVLQRREGYRDVFRAYLEFELAARLSWRGADSSYAAGQRDVATLYEYWVFLQLAKVVAQLTGHSFDLRPLVEVRADGLNVVLQSGKEIVVSGIVERANRRMKVELCFNRTFGEGARDLSSWTRPMRPDCSLIVSAAPGEAAGFEPLVLHFDAKYRVDQLFELFGDADTIDPLSNLAPTEERIGRKGALREDLLKMHAYRDAIRRSAGAYVLYPGNDVPSNRARYSEYHELLPGLGAFVLRPTHLGDPGGIATLRTFLDQVLEHVATRLTQHERGRYWLEEVYGRYDATRERAARLLVTYPGTDTTVLLGYVKNAAHWNWIHEFKVYNVRTTGRRGGVAPDAELLYSQLLLLYCPELGSVALARIVSGPELVEKHAMKRTGYPSPSSDYLCVQLSFVPGEEIRAPVNADQIVRLVESRGKLRGEPTAVRWSELI